MGTMTDTGHGTIVLINEVDRIVTTIFRDGTKLHAAPTMDEESKARAAALGYTHPAMDDAWLAEAVWCMTKDHERLHHLVAEALGRPHSMALWIAAHPDQMARLQSGEAMMQAINMRAQAHDEERIVLLIQRLLNEGLGETDAIP